MKRTNIDPFECSAVLLSIFDVSGSLLTHNISWPLNGIQHDMSQLIKDHKALEEDYQNACEKVAKNLKD